MKPRPKTQGPRNELVTPGPRPEITTVPEQVITPIVRPHPMLRFPGNGQTERADLHRGLRVRELVFRLVGQLTLTAAQNVPANFKRGDELGAVVSLIVWFRGVIIANLTGDDLWWLMFQR